MIDKDGTVLRNLEDQVQYLTDLNEWASLGFTIAGKMISIDNLPAADTLPNGTTYIIGTTAPYHFWAAVNGGWVDLGEFPRSGPPGIKGEKGDSIVGPRGPAGAPSQIPGPAGKNGGGLGVDNITDINLATGTQSVTYDSTNGATVTAQGKIVAAGQDYNINVTDKLPIIPGSNINITANGTNDALVIEAEQNVLSVNGQVGVVTLDIPTKTSQLTNDSGYITNSYHDSTKQNTLISGDNIKTINNESILGPGNITISGGTAGVTSLNGKTGAINIVEGSNVTVNTSGNTITISATGGGGGTVELPFIELSPTQNTYPINSEFTDSDAEKLTKDYFSSILLKPSGSDYYIPMLPQASQRDNHQYIWQGHDQNYTYTITATLQKVLDASSSYVWTAKFYTIDQETWSNSNVKQTTGFYRYDGIINMNPVVGGTYQYNDSLTLYEYTNGCTYTQGQMIIDRNGVISKVIDPTHARVAYIPQSGGSTYSVVEITSSTKTLTDEQYNTLTASPFNKIKLNNEIYDLYKETSAELTYTANYFNNGYQITIKKDTKAVSTGSLSSLIAISAFVKNDLNYNQSNNRFALSAYQGKVLNDRLTAVENGGGTIYQHTLTYNSDKFSDTDQFSGTEVQGSFSISFYSTHGHFNDASEFWTWLIGRGSISVCDGQLWGSMGGGTSFSRITVLGNTDAEKYIQFESYAGYGEWSSIQYYLKNPAATGLTDTITDGFRDM